MASRTGNAIVTEQPPMPPPELVELPTWGWEYDVYTEDQPPMYAYDRLMYALEGKGNAGWELVSVIALPNGDIRHYFKRRKAIRSKQS